MKESKRYNSEGQDLKSFSKDFQLKFSDRFKTLKEWIELAEERGKEIDGLKMKLYHLAKESIQAKEQLKSKDKEIEELKRELDEWQISSGY